MAMGLAHESVHAGGEAEAGTPAGGLEEVKAWDRALEVYQSLRGKNLRDATAAYRRDLDRRRAIGEKAYRIEKYCFGANEVSSGICR